jgi:hypothetical protein
MDTVAAADRASWLAAVVARRPPAASAAALTALRRQAEEAGLELHVLGTHHGGGDGSGQPGEVHVDPAAVRATLAGLLERGIGPGLVGAVGRLPGLPARVVRLPGGLDGLRAVVSSQRDLRRARAVPALDDDPAWTLALDEVDTVLQRVEESLLVVADGWFGTRGSLEEDGPGSDPAVVVSGVYTDGEVGPIEVTPTLLPGPRWTQLELAPELGEVVRRTLDLRTGLLLRVTPDPAGGPDLRVLRLACLARPGVGLLWAEGPVAQLGPGQPLVQADGAPARRGASGHHRAVEASSVGRIAAEATDEVADVGPRRTVRRTVRFQRSVAPPWSASEHPGEGELVDEPPAPELVPPEGLVAEQRAAWAQRWAHADVEIEGDPELQLAVRTGLFHLMSSVPDRGEAAVGPRGITGVAYRGHVFWDADVFVLPFLAATHPAAAAAMLAYRVARLPAARRVAAEAGYAGARFPWESAHDGRDVTPTSVISLDGAELSVVTGRYQEHITADVAWAAAHHLDWTGDRRFERGPGRTLLFETARYWRSRVSLDATGRGHLLAVMGPDEYHAPVDDDAFTNGLVRWNLRRAASLVGAATPSSSSGRRPPGTTSPNGSSTATTRPPAGTSSSPATATSRRPRRSGSVRRWPPTSCSGRHGSPPRR